MKVIAVLSPGLELQGAKELLELGVSSAKPQKRCVAFETDIRTLYRVNLLARLPFRFLREIAQFPCNTPQDLYQNVRSSFDWHTWLKPTMSFRVDVSGIGNALRHTHFTALQVKNAIVDLQRERWGSRSDIDVVNPDLCIHLHLAYNHAILSLGTSSKTLHKRGYRPAMGIAPLKENLAAGLIGLTGWKSEVPLVDPLCGSGTFLIEAASIASGLAPGLNRDHLFQRWADFDLNIWNEEHALAISNYSKSIQLPILLGCENDLQTFNQAKLNIRESGFQESIKIQNTHFRNLELPKQKGILLCNPPYGKRIGANQNLEGLYQELGTFCKQKASGWHLWILNGNANLSKFLRLKSSRRFPVSNGGIDCRWLHYEIN